MALLPSESQASSEIFLPRNLPFTIALPLVSLLPGPGHQDTLATEDIGLPTSKLLPFQFIYYKVAKGSLKSQSHHGAILLFKSLR